MTATTVPFKFYTFSGAVAVYTRNMNLVTVNCSQEALQSNNTPQIFEYRFGDATMAHDLNSWNDFTFPNQPTACIVDEYRVDCTDPNSNKYIK